MDREAGGLYAKGNPGGPGRPKGSRSKLSEAFLKALSDDFTKNGLATVQKVRIEKPDVYLNVIGKLMPKLLEMSGPDGEPIQAHLNYLPICPPDK